MWMNYIHTSCRIYDVFGYKWIKERNEKTFKLKMQQRKHYKQLIMLNESQIISLKDVLDNQHFMASSATPIKSLAQEINEDDTSFEDIEKMMKNVRNLNEKMQKQSAALSDDKWMND